MKQIFVSLIFLFVFSVATFAQTNETAPCPTLSVTGPAGVPQPNEPQIFTANIGDTGKTYNLKYRWTVSSGEIIDGQGTITLKVLQKDLGDNLTATVEITGLPENCSNTASETAAICDCVQFIKVDEYSVSASQIDKARIENFANELRKNPTAQGYIIELFDSSVSKKTVEAKRRKIFGYFTTIGFEKDRIILLNGLANLNSLPNKNSTQFFIVPAGATPPYCNDCVKARP